MTDNQKRDATTEEFSVDQKEQPSKVAKMEEALKRIRDCNWIITLPDRMDAVRAIAREALE